MENKTLFAILVILFNNIGVPSFIQGDVKTGILRIVLNFVTCGIVGCINFIMGIILGIEILQMSDEEYAAKKGTFNRGWPTLKA